MEITYILLTPKYFSLVNTLLSLLYYTIVSVHVFHENKYNYHIVTIV